MESVCQKFPRTLIISANSLSTQSNNGKMVASFFKEYPPESLAQLYTWPEYPDCSLCDNYYRITDKEMMHSWFGKIPGQRVECRSVQKDAQMPSIFRKSFKIPLNNSCFVGTCSSCKYTSKIWIDPPKYSVKSSNTDASPCLPTIVLLTENNKIASNNTNINFIKVFIVNPFSL